MTTTHTAAENCDSLEEVALRAAKSELHQAEVVSVNLVNVIKTYHAVVAAGEVITVCDDPAEAHERAKKWDNNEQKRRNDR